MEVSNFVYPDRLFRYTVQSIFSKGGNKEAICCASQSPSVLYFITDLNAKGVILQSFEEFRLRSCVDFKPYEGESSFISFAKMSG